MFVLYEVRVQAMVLGVNGKLSGGSDVGHNSPGRSASS
jgi:hypothetical protein